MGFLKKGCEMVKYQLLHSFNVGILANKNWFVTFFWEVFWNIFLKAVFKIIKVILFSTKGLFS